MACAEQKFGVDPTVHYDQGSYVGVTEPITFTDTPYAANTATGVSSISSLLGVFPAQEFVWYGLGKDDPYPYSGDCDPGRPAGVTAPQNLASLPMTIEGTVTLHPRYFQKIAVCGSDERYYGSYVLQDATGGILVLRDSRIAEFDYGDRVRLRVRGVLKYFDTRAVLVYDQEEILTSSASREPIYYQRLTRNFVAADSGQVFRVRGRVIGEATNQNFNEMKIQSLDAPGIEWLVSIDRELGTRGVSPKAGDILEVTGPVLNSFGLRILVASLGQMELVTP
ncbi:MAG: hypothetical protein H0U74_22010 [Bradymonadaceae bacterium]|nr:hypothetical protein [Lujinxingiaceae bacterium]